MGVREFFKENLKYYRQQAGLTQEQLSEKIDYGVGYISEIESRQIFPKPETIDLIADALGIKAAQLFDERGSPKNIQNNFQSTYGSDLEKELKQRINKDIEDVCRLI